MNIRYDCRWSDQADTKFINDYNYVQNIVFGGDHSELSFKKQFTSNIYGPSVVVVVYMDEQPVAARALWRNDIEGKEAYQPGQTCVTEPCRGKGIFSEMTRNALSMLPKDAIIYNFPNNNSFPGYIKLGWKLKGEFRPRLLMTNSQYKKEHPILIPKDYVDWWIKNVNGIKYVRYFGVYYLCRHDTPRPFFHIIGRVDEAVAKQFPKAGKWGLLFYLSANMTFYNRRYNPLRVVFKNDNDINIPTWKIDVI